MRIDKVEVGELPLHPEAGLQFRHRHNVHRTERCWQVHYPARSGLGLQRKQRRTYFGGQASRIARARGAYTSSR